MAARTKSFSLMNQPVFTAIAIVCFVVLYLPILTLVVYAFNDSALIGVWTGFSPRWFSAALANDRIQEAVFRSFYLAVFAATLSTVMAMMAALATTRTEPYRGMTLKYALINQPLIVPEIVTGVALLIVFSRVKVLTGYAGMGYLIAAHTAFCIPFAFLPIRARLESMDLALERAAADLYATPWEVFRFVTLPLLWPGILAGYMLAFIVSLDDVVVTELVKSAGQDTLPTYMLGQLKRIVTPEVNAAATALLAVSVLFVTAYFFVSKKRS